MSEENVSQGSGLADLNQLLDYGFLTENLTVDTGKGEFRFELKSITPLEEAEASKAVRIRVQEDDTLELNVHTAIEFLARTVTKVNGIELEKLPYAKGDTDLQRKRSVIAKFSEKLMNPLWETYLTLKRKSSGTLTPEETDAVKKS